VQTPKKQEKWRPTWFDLTKMEPNVVSFEKNCALHALIGKNAARDHMKTFFGGQTKKRSSLENIPTKSGPKFFSGKNPSHPQKFACSYTCAMVSSCADFLARMCVVRLVVTKNCML